MKRYLAFTVLTAGIIVSGLLPRGCKMDTVTKIGPHDCGCVPSVEIRKSKVRTGFMKFFIAPDTAVGTTTPKTESYNPADSNYNPNCHCPPPPPEKKPVPKPVPKPHPVSAPCKACAGGLGATGTLGGDMKAMIQRNVHGHAATITQEFGIPEVDFIINAYVSPNGIIDSVPFTVANAAVTVSHSTLAAQVIPQSGVIGSQVEAPGGSKDCRWTFYASAKQ